MASWDEWDLPPSTISAPDGRTATPTAARRPLGIMTRAIAGRLRELLACRRGR